jgi:hypothetical protein
MRNLVVLGFIKRAHSGDLEPIHLNKISREEIRALYAGVAKFREKLDAEMKRRRLQDGHRLTKDGPQTGPEIVWWVNGGKESERLYGIRRPSKHAPNRYDFWSGTPYEGHWIFPGKNYKPTQWTGMSNADVAMNFILNNGRGDEPCPQFPRPKVNTDGDSQARSKKQKDGRA